MRTFLFSLLLCFAVSVVRSQPAVIDSLSNELHKTSNDTLRLVLFSKLGDAQMDVNMDSALFYAQQYLKMSQDLKYVLNEADALQQTAEYMLELGSSGNGLELSFKALQMLENNQRRKNVLPSEYLQMLHIPKRLH